MFNIFRPRPPRPPPPPPPPQYSVVTYTWVKVGRREELESKTARFGTLAEAKASLKGQVFYIAKIYFRLHELVDTVRGTQPKPKPLS